MGKTTATWECPEKQTKNPKQTLRQSYSSQVCEATTAVGVSERLVSDIWKPCEYPKNF